MAAFCSGDIPDDTRIEAMHFIRRYWAQLGGTIVQRPPAHGYKMRNRSNPRPVIFAELKGGPKEKARAKSHQRFGKSTGRDFYILRCKRQNSLKKALGAAIVKITADGGSGLHVTINWPAWRKSVKTILNWAWRRAVD